MNKNKKTKKKAQTIGNFDTYVALSAALQARYGDSIRICIDADCVRSWRHGERLQRGTPPPPAKRGNYFIGKEWCVWFERFILSHHGHAVTGAEQDLAVLAQQAKFRTTILAEKEAALNLSILDGQTMRKSEVTRIVIDLAASLNAIQNSALELRARVALKERLGAANLTMEPTLLDFVCEYLKSINRQLKETIKEKMLYEENES